MRFAFVAILTGIVAWHSPAEEKSGASTSLFQRTSVIGEDDRRLITEKGVAAELGLTKEQVAQIRSTTGIIQCPNYWASASIISDGVRQFAVTVAHALYNEKGQLRSGPCRFTNQAANQQSSELLIDQAYVGTTNPDDKDGHTTDWASVPLKKSLRDIVPLTVGVASMNEGKLISVSGTMAGYTKGNDKVPIVQEFNFRISKKQPPMAYTDADIQQGSSGGANLQLIDGALVLVGVTFRGTDPKFDGLPYNLSKTNGKPLNYNNSVLFMPDTVQALSHAIGATHICQKPEGDVAKYSDFLKRVEKTMVRVWCKLDNKSAPNKFKIRNHHARLFVSGTGILVNDKSTVLATRSNLNIAKTPGEYRAAIPEACLVEDALGGFSRVKAIRTWLPHGGKRHSSWDAAILELEDDIPTDAEPFPLQSGHMGGEGAKVLVLSRSSASDPRNQCLARLGGITKSLTRAAEDANGFFRIDAISPTAEPGSPILSLSGDLVGLHVKNNDLEGIGAIEIGPPVISLLAEISKRRQSQANQ